MYLALGTPAHVPVAPPTKTCSNDLVMYEAAKYYKLLLKGHPKAPSGLCALPYWSGCSFLVAV